MAKDPTRPLEPKDRPPRDTRESPADDPDDLVKERKIDERELAREHEHRKK